MDDTFALTALAVAALGTLGWGLPRTRRRLQLSRAKHRSLGGHARMAQRVARLVPGYAYDEAGFFGAVEYVNDLRRAACAAIQPRCCSTKSSARARETPFGTVSFRVRVPAQTRSDTRRARALVTIFSGSPSIVAGASGSGFRPNSLKRGRWPRPHRL